MASLKNVKDFINKYDFFYILGHERPDGDCIGSQLAMSGLLDVIGKKHVVLSAGPFNDSISQSYRSKFTTSLDELDFLPMKKENAALIFLDASDPNRMGKIFNDIYHLPALIIDHHASNKGEDFGDVRYILPEIPANTILVYRVFKEFKIKLNQAQAYYIFLGMLTDTQFFRFVKDAQQEPFLIAADLITLGITPGDIYKQISYGYTYLSRKVLSKVLERAQRLNNNRIILTHISEKDYLHVDDIPQSFEIYQMLEGTHKTEVIVYLQEVLNEKNVIVTKVGMRSKAFNVGAIAKDWGGGGHANASGFTIEQSLTETIPLMVQFFDTLVI